MSNQSYANPFDPYWLSSRGINAVNFNKNTSPPVAFFNKGILYELTDGKLYYNGSEVQTSSSNPLLYDPTNIYVSSNSSGTIISGARDINNPLSTITEALSLVDSDIGATLYCTGNFSAESVVTLPANCVIDGNQLSFRCLTPEIIVGGSTFDNPPAFGINQSFLHCVNAQNPITYDTSLFTEQSLLVIDNSVVQGNLTCIDSSDCTDLLLVKDCIISSTLYIQNQNANIINSVFGISVSSGSIGINHSVNTNDMTVTIDATVVNGSILSISATSTTNILTVNLLGNMNFSAINIDTQNPGCLVLNIDDYTPITWTIGSEANTTVNYIKKADQVSYNPAVPGDWSPPPVQVAEALDQLAANSLTSQNINFNGVSYLDGSNQNLLAGVNLNIIFSVTNDLFDYIHANANIANFYYHMDRILVLGESFNIRLLQNGNPIAFLGSGVGGMMDDTSPQSTIVPVNVNFIAGDQMVILVNAWVPIGANINFSWSLYGAYN